MKKEYDYITFILRASPFHDGHLQILNKAHQMADNVIVLIGGANRPRTVRNPWTFFERKHMILDSIPHELWLNTHILPLNEHFYDELAWKTEVHEKVYETIHFNSLCQENNSHLSTIRIGMIGCVKDKISGHITAFPDFEPIIEPVEVDITGTIINATEIRDHFFSCGTWSNLPPAVNSHLMGFRLRPEYFELKEEYECYQKGKQEWRHSPYPPTFVAGDAVVAFEHLTEARGYILTVTRGRRPGKGMLALPGGFLDQYEWWSDTAYRELHEETGINVPTSVLRDRTIETKVFDYPFRSLRGRMLTQASFIHLEGTILPTIEGSDDAASAQWIPFDDLTPMNMFDDHYDITRYFIEKHNNIFRFTYQD